MAVARLPSGTRTAARPCQGSSGRGIAATLRRSPAAPARPTHGPVRARVPAAPAPAASAARGASA
eukprot:12122578-Heterocapsa_arctica.AAC.1